MQMLMSPRMEPPSGVYLWTPPMSWRRMPHLMSIWRCECVLSACHSFVIIVITLLITSLITSLIISLITLIKHITPLIILIKHTDKAHHTT